MYENSQTHMLLYFVCVLICISEVTTHSKRRPGLEELIWIEDPLIVGAQQRTSASS